MKIPFFDLTEQYEQTKDEIHEVVNQVFEMQHFILGKNVTTFERKFAEYCGTKYCVAVSSGTDALLAALMSLEIGVGDEVILPDFTFFATAGVIARLKAKPVFVDIKPDTFNINCALIEKAITPKTKAIIPVHLFGQCAAMDEINDIAKKYGIPVIEDACQAVGAEYKDNRKAGNLGTMGCFSFYPTKNLGGAGDSGAITTNDEKLYTKLKQIRNHGMEPKYFHSFIGGNFRMDEIQAAVLNVKLKYLENLNNLRRINHNFYRKFFIDFELTICCEKEPVPNKTYVILPYSEYVNCGITNYHTFHQYSILTEKRDELKKYLADNEIGTDIYYPMPLHKQKCFEELNYKDADFEQTNYVAQHILALPIFPEIAESQIFKVVEKIAQFFNKK